MRSSESRGGCEVSERSGIEALQLATEPVFEAQRKLFQPLAFRTHRRILLSSSKPMTFQRSTDSEGQRRRTSLQKGWVGTSRCNNSTTFSVFPLPRTVTTLHFILENFTVLHFECLEISETAGMRPLRQLVSLIVAVATTAVRAYCFTTQRSYRGLLITGKTF